MPDNVVEFTPTEDNPLSDLPPEGGSSQEAPEGGKGEPNGEARENPFSTRDTLAEHYDKMIAADPENPDNKDKTPEELEAIKKAKPGEEEDHV